MKGRPIKEIAKELQFIRENSRDIIAHPGILSMTQDSRLIVHDPKSKKNPLVEPTSWAHGQIGTYLKIPKDYYDRMKTEQPELLAKNVNTWLESQGPKERRMLRMVGNRLRAFVSNSYKILDAYDLMNVVYPILMKSGMQVTQSELTESRLYIKATHPNMKGLVAPGDEVIGGVTISTSDVGAGRALIEPYSLRLRCTNGLISENALAQRHVGKRQGDETPMEILSQEAIEADSKAFFLKVRDVLIDSIKPESFERQVDRFREAAGRPITQANLTHVVELATRKTSITQKWMKEDIVKQLLTGNEGAGLTQWGLANSFTALAKSDKVDYDTSIELERAGGRIVALDGNEWKALAQS